MIGHVTPEAYDGGPIALVQNGDMITIDAKNRTLDLVSSQHIPHTHTHTTNTPTHHTDMHTVSNTELQYTLAFRGVVRNADTISM